MRRLTLVTVMLAALGCRTGGDEAELAELRGTTNAKTKVAGSDAATEAPTPLPRTPPSGPCHDIDVSALTPKAQAFMQANNMNGGATWYPLYVTENLGKCILILGLSPDDVMPTEAEFLTVSMTGKLGKLEAAFPPPTKLRVAIGALWVNVESGEWVPNDNFYYTELKGASARDAYKAIVARFPVSGLSKGCIAAQITDPTGDCKAAPTGKLAWDPTPERTWKLSNAEYSLRRGSVDEVDDVYSGQLDGDFQGYVCGTLPCQTGGQAKGSTQAWGSPIARYFQDGQWKTVSYDQRFAAKPATAESFTHEARFKEDADGAECYAAAKAVTGVKRAEPMIYGPPGGDPAPIGVFLTIASDKAPAAVAALRAMSCVAGVLSY